MTGPRSLANHFFALLALVVAGLEPATLLAQCASSGEFLDETTGRLVRLELSVDSPGPQARAFNEDCDRLPIRGTVTPTAIPEPVDVVIVIDVSPSAFDCSGADVDGDGITGPAGERCRSTHPGDTIAAAEVAAARLLVERMAGTDSRFCVIRYGGSAVVEQYLTTDLDAVHVALDGVARDSISSTSYFPALELAEAVFALQGLPGRGRLVLFLSDGDSGASGRLLPRFEGADCSRFPIDVGCNELLLIEEMGHQGLRLDSFAVGVGANQEVLGAMAEVGGGRLYPVPDPGEIDESFGELLVGVQSLRIENLTTGEIVELPSPRNGEWEARIAPAAGLNELRVSAFASRPAGGRVDCEAVFEFVCLEASCPSDQQLACEGELAAPTIGFEASADDASALVSHDSPHASLGNGGNADGFYPLGETRVRFDFEHPWAETWSCERIVTVEDSEPPRFEAGPGGFSVSCDAVPAPVPPPVVEACDPSPAIELQEERVNSPCADRYQLERTWTVVDAAGGSDEFRQLFFVWDDDPPTLFGLGEDFQTSCAVVPAPPTVDAVDDCDPHPTLAFDELQVPGDCPGRYRLERRWTATDRCGNSVTAMQQVEVVDETPPVLAGVPADAVVACREVPAPATPVVVDACDPAPNLDFAETVEPGPCPDSRVIRRTWTATDACGNASLAEQRIDVVDDVPPALEGVPVDVVVPCHAVPAPAHLSAVDDCDPDPRVEMEELVESGSCPDRFLLVRTWTATDRCGNASVAVQRLEVVDEQAPELLGVPADAVVPCHAVPAPARPSAVDECDPVPRVELEERIEPGSCPDRYRLVRTWTATDRCGNASVAVQRLDVVDEQAPELLGVPANQVIECPELPPPPAVRAVDACDPDPAVSYSETRIPGDCPGRWTVLRDWTATDRCGLSTSARQVIEVVDTTPPVVAPSTEAIACLWPPNHRRVGFSLEDFGPRAEDACSRPIDWRLSHCLSSQPDDATGDGHTEGDCVISEDGRSVLVRAERRGDGPDAEAGRTYTLFAIATDACGNAAEPAPIGAVHVPHDSRSGTAGCLAR